VQEREVPDSGKKTHQVKRPLREIKVKPTSPEPRKSNQNLATKPRSSEKKCSGGNKDFGGGTPDKSKSTWTFLVDSGDRELVRGLKKKLRGP